MNFILTGLVLSVGLQQLIILVIKYSIDYWPE